MKIFDKNAISLSKRMSSLFVILFIIPPIYYSVFLYNETSNREYDIAKKYLDNISYKIDGHITTALKQIEKMYLFDDFNDYFDDENNVRNLSEITDETETDIFIYDINKNKISSNQKELIFPSDMILEECNKKYLSKLDSNKYNDSFFILKYYKNEGYVIIDVNSTYILEKIETDEKEYDGFSYKFINDEQVVDDTDIINLHKLNLFDDGLFLSTSIPKENAYHNLNNHIYFITIFTIFYVSLSFYIYTKVIKKYKRNLIKDFENIINKTGNGDFSNTSELLMYPTFSMPELNDLAIAVYKLNERVISHYCDVIKHLEKTDNLKSQFIANVSHEIRTPLNAIIGYVQLINKMDIKCSNKLESYLHSIDNCSHILLQRINDVLELSKIESGQIDIIREEVSIEKLFEDVKDVLNFSVENKDIQIEVYIADDVPDIVIGDEHKLMQILMNLGNNAVKFTENGYIKLSVSKGFYITTDSIIVLNWSVKDTGKGISQENLKTVFDAFIQEDPTIKRKFGGTGLGLTIVKRLVNLMGGTINVNSIQGEGTEFTFNTVHIMSLEKKSIEEADVLEISDDIIKDILVDKKILLVEDNIVNQLLIAEIFKFYYYDNLVVASNGREAIDIVNNEEVFDLILMDVQMPEMDGMETTQIIRNKGEYSEVPIIALTANAYTEQIAHYINSGMTDFLAKPLELAELKIILKKYLT